jgi:Protein of unknown function (DUF732)
MSTMSSAPIAHTDPIDPGTNPLGMFASARRMGTVGLAILAVVVLGPDPEASAAPSPPCPQGPAPGPGPGCGRRAFLADVTTAGLANTNGDAAAIQQGLDICGLMDAGLSRQNMVSQFAADNPTLGSDGAAQVVRFAIRDMCPWHR